MASSPPLFSSEPQPASACSRSPLEEQVQDLQCLHEATLRALRARDLDSAMREILRSALAAIESSQGFLTLRPAEDQGLPVSVSEGFAEGLDELISPVPTDATYDQKSRVVVEDATTDPRFSHHREAVRLGGFRSCHSVPLIVRGGEVLGVLTACFHDRHTPSEREEWLLDHYAQMGADLIARFEEERLQPPLSASECSDIRAGKYAAALSQLTQELTELEDDVAIIRRATQMVGEHLGAQLCYFVEHEADSRVVVSDHWSNNESSSLAGRYDMKDFGPPEWWHAIATGSLGVTDVGVHPLTRDFAESYEQIGIRSYAAAPYLRHGQWIASLSVTRPVARVWTPDDLAFLENAVARIWPIVERARSEAALRATDRKTQLLAERYRHLVHSLPIAVYTCNAAGQVELFNEAAVTLWGRAPEMGVDQWCGSARMFWTDGRHLPLDECPMAIAMKENRPLQGIEAVVERPDGTRRYILAHPHPVRDENGAVIGAVNALVDITDRRAADEAKRRLAAIVESSADAIVGKDLNGIVTSWNAGAQHLFGYTAEEVIGKSVTQLIPPDRQTEEPAILARLRRGERVEHFETLRRRKDGTLVEVSLSISPIRGADGHIVGASKIARDITEHKRHAAELRRRDQLYRAIGESINYGIWIADVEGHNLYASDSFLQLVGLTQEQCSRFGWSSVLHPDEIESTLAAWKTCARTGTFWEREHRFKGVDGQWHPVLARGVPIRDDNGQIIHWVGINLDISAFKEVEGALRSAQLELRARADELEQKVEERTASLRQAVTQMEEFSYSVSHDLRAPLRAIVGYAQVLKDEFSDQLDAEGNDYLDRIVRGGERMDKLTRDVLTLGKMSRAAVALERVSLDSLVRDLVQQMPALQEPNAEIVVGPLGDVFGHPAYLTQAISNLLGNAVKFVAPGRRPRVRVWAEQNCETIRLWIEDNGIGIKPEHHERIFGIFERIHPLNAYEGTGVGLAIVRKAMERMGGRAGVESDGATGSRFWLQLPLPQ